MLGIVVWDFKGEEGNSHGDGKANLVNKCLSCLAQTKGHGEDLDQIGLASFLPVYHT